MGDLPEFGGIEQRELAVCGRSDVTIVARIHPQATGLERAQDEAGHPELVGRRDRGV